MAVRSVYRWICFVLTVCMSASLLTAGVQARDKSHITAHDPVANGVAAQATRPAAVAAAPYVTGTTPADGATYVARDLPQIAATISFPSDLNNGVKGDSLKASTVYLRKLSDEPSGPKVPAVLGTSGGDDIIVLTPQQILEPFTQYKFTVTSGVRDKQENPFQPYSMTFTTGSLGGPGGSRVKFSRQATISGQFFTSLLIGPDHKLYASNIYGRIYRYVINGTDGSLTPDPALSPVGEIRTVQEYEKSINPGNTNGDRLLIGMAFDPASTASAPILWVSHTSAKLNNNFDHWSGKISRLSGPNLQNYQDYVVGLPRSTKDHVTNSIAFGPDGAIYFNQGASNAMGAPDTTWGNQEERLLSAAMLRININNITSPPLNVQTDEGGTYNPYAPGAPLTIYATGVRNAYDLVWHSNGKLYVPANGSAAGGNTPATPANYQLLPQCINRPDGPYTGPDVQGIANVNQTEPDYLFKVEQGAYYGHPNPSRCEWVLNGGNPSAGIDPAEFRQYPVGTLPDRNYHEPAFNFQNNKSPNGAIEYQSNTFGGALKNKLLVVRFSGGDDIIVLDPSGPNGDIVGSQTGIPGFSGFNDPLDLVEDPDTGNLYVAAYQRENGNSERILWLLRPAENVASIVTSPRQLVFNDVAGDATSSPEQTIVISNTGQQDLNITNVSVASAVGDSTQFTIAQFPATTVAPGGSTTVKVKFTAATPYGPVHAMLRIQSNDASTPNAEISLDGLSTQANGGAGEPSLQRIMDTYQRQINVGDDDPATSDIHSSTPYADLLGDETSLQKLKKAGDGPVTIEPLAVFGPTSADPIVKFGWYDSGNAGSTHEVFNVDNTPTSNGQTLNVSVNGALSFDPGSATFGFYSQWPYFPAYTIYSEDDLNTFDTEPRRHHVRVYPLRNPEGNIEANSYVVAFEEQTNGKDFQDIVVIVRNVKPFAPPVPLNCPPRSTLKCDQVPVAPPYVLDWNESEGSISDKNGLGTGFTMVDPSSNREASDGAPSNPQVRGYEPANLVVDTSAGTLAITASKGILQANINTQLNALGVGTDLDNRTLRYETIVRLPTDVSNKYEQAGVWFGKDQDNYVKLVAVSDNTVASGKYALQMLIETGATPGLSINPSVSINGGDTVRLVLDIDNRSSSPKTITGWYSVNGGQLTKVQQGGTASLMLNAALVSGVNHDNNAMTPKLTFGGIFATRRNNVAPTPPRFTFERFALNDLAPISGLALTADTSEPYPGETVTFEATTTSGTPVSYQWDFGDGTTATTSVPTVQHSYTGLGAKMVKVTATSVSGATANASTSVTVKDQMIAGLAITSDQPTDLGQPTTFQATTTAGTNVSYTWDFGDGSPVVQNGSTISHTYATTGNYTVTVTASNSRNTYSAELEDVVVRDEAITGLQLSSNSPVTRNKPVTLTATVATGTGLLYTWDFGDGSPTVNSSTPTIEHTYSATGSYTATVKVDNSLPDPPVEAETVIEVTTDEVAIAGLQVTNDGPTKAGERTTFTATKTAGTNVTYVWNFGDGTSPVPGGPTIQHIYTTPTTYTATVTASNSLGSAYAVTKVRVTADDEPVTDLAISSADRTEVNRSLGFDAVISTGTGVTYEWNFGDGSASVTTTGTHVDHTYTATGTYTVTLTAKNNQGLWSTTKQVQVLAEAEAIAGLKVEVETEPPFMVHTPLTFTASTTAGTNITNYAWDFGDGTTVVNNGPEIEHSYTKAGTYTVKVTATNSKGAASATLEVEVQSNGTLLYLPLILNTGPGG